MRKKVGTLLEESLFRRTKMQSVRQGKQFSEIVAEALELYLSQKGGAPTTGGVVAESFGVIRLPKRRLKKVLTEEASLLDSR